MNLVERPLGFHQLRQFVERGCVCFVRKIGLGFLKAQNRFPVNVIWPLGENMACQHPLTVPAEKMGWFPSGPLLSPSLSGGQRLNLGSAGPGNKNGDSLPTRDPRMKFLHLPKVSQWGPSIADGEEP